MTQHRSRRPISDPGAPEQGTDPVSDWRGSHQRAVETMLEKIPAHFRSDVETWVLALRGNGHRPSRPLAWVSVRNYLNFALPALEDWGQSYTSLSEVTRNDVEHALATHTGKSAHNVHTALRSLFRGLKREKRIFTDPARAVIGHYTRKVPRPLPSDGTVTLLNAANWENEA